MVSSGPGFRRRVKLGGVLLGALTLGRWRAKAIKARSICACILSHFREGTLVDDRWCEALRGRVVYSLSASSRTIQFSRPWFSSGVGSSFEKVFKDWKCTEGFLWSCLTLKPWVAEKSCVTVAMIAAVPAESTVV